MAREGWRMAEARERGCRSSRPWPEGRRPQARAERVSEGWTGSSPPGTGRGEEMAAGKARFVDVGAGR